MFEASPKVVAVIQVQLLSALTRRQQRPQIAPMKLPHRTWGLTGNQRLFGTECQVALQCEAEFVMASAELLMSSDVSQGMQVRVEASQRKGSGTSPKPAAGVNFPPFLSCVFFCLSSLNPFLWDPV